MIRLFFKTIWNNRRRNILVFIELFMISLIMVNLTIYLVNMLAIYRIKNCYDSKNVVQVSIGKKLDEDEKVTEQSFQNLKKVFASNSFVEAVSICANAIPYTYNVNSTEFRHDSDRFGMDTRLTDIEYGKVMKIAMSKGRWFDESDLGKAVEPIIISNDIDKKYFKGDAVGKRIEDSENKISFEIIGVVERFKRNDIESPAPFAFFLKEKVASLGSWGSCFLIRTSENKTSNMLAIAESQVYSTLDPQNWTIESLNSLENMRDGINVQIYQRNYLTVIIALFIMINVFLGTIGILWYNTNLRIHEIGIKRALGSTGKGIKGLLILENLFIAGLGLLIVVVVMLQMPSFVGRQLPEPGVLKYSILVSTLIMIILVLLSTWIPSTIASKIRPAIALKTE
jgi:putative ABC transport system permease protein